MRIITEITELTWRLWQQDCKVSGTWKDKYLFPVAIETAGSWSLQAIELVQEIGRRSSSEGKCGLILRHFPRKT